MIRFAVVAVTMNCNARCVMCNIWKNNFRDELAPEHYAKLPSTLEEINITGGEPFLRKDLADIVSNMKIAAPDAKPIFSSSGILTRSIERQAPAILEANEKVAFRISIDGLGETHDKVRGVPGAFKKALESVELLRSAGANDLGIHFTVSNLNTYQIVETYNFCRDQGLQFGLTPCSDSEIYFGDLADDVKKFNVSEYVQQSKAIESERLRGWKPKEWARAWFDAGSRNFVENGKRPLPCNAASESFYMDSFGTVFSCNILDQKIGSILEHDTFEAMWNTHAREAIAIEASKCNECWIMCTAKSAIRENRIGVIGNVLTRKINRHLHT